MGYLLSRSLCVLMTRQRPYRVVGIARKQQRRCYLPQDAHGMPMTLLLLVGIAVEHMKRQVRLLSPVWRLPKPRPGATVRSRPRAHMDITRLRMDSVLIIMLRWDKVDAQVAALTQSGSLLAAALQREKRR